MFLEYSSGNFRMQKFCVSASLMKILKPFIKYKSPKPVGHSRHVRRTEDLPSIISIVLSAHYLLYENFTFPSGESGSNFGATKPCLENP